MLTFTSRDNDHTETKNPKLPAKIETIEFSYDGGRVGVTINGKQVFYSMLGGIDCKVELTVK